MMVFLLVGVLGFISCGDAQTQSAGGDVRVIKERDTDISQPLTYEGSMERSLSIFRRFKMTGFPKTVRA